MWHAANLPGLWFSIHSSRQWRNFSSPSLEVFDIFRARVPPRFSSRFETDAVEQPRQIAGKLSVPSTIALTFDANIPSLRLPFSKPFVFTMFTFRIRLKASTFPDDRLFAIVCEISTNKRFVSLDVLGLLTIFYIIVCWFRWIIIVRGGKS